MFALTIVMVIYYKDKVHVCKEMNKYIYFYRDYLTASLSHGLCIFQVKWLNKMLRKKKLPTICVLEGSST